MSIKLPEINTVWAERNDTPLLFQWTNAVENEYQKIEKRRSLENNASASLRTLLYRYNKNQDWDRYNKVANILNNIQHQPDDLLKQILNAKEREEMQNSEIYKAYRLQQAQKQMGCIKRLNNGYANTKSNLTKNPNSTTKLPPINSKNLTKKRLQNKPFDISDLDKTNATNTNKRPKWKR